MMRAPTDNVMLIRAMKLYLSTRFLTVAILTVLALLGTRRVSAQTPAALKVTTNAPAAIIYVDSVALGRIGGAPFSVKPGTRVLRLAPTGPDAWSVPPEKRVIHPEAGDTLYINLRVPYRYRINSTPYGADVYVRRSSQKKKLGVTPLRYATDQPLSHPVIVTKEGYESTRIHPDSALWNEHAVQLTAKPKAKRATAEVEWAPPEHRRIWIDAAALGVALAAGAVAIHYKFKADQVYDTYRSGPRRGDEALRSRFERYDRRSAVALGVMQAGVTVFTLRLVL